MKKADEWVDPLKRLINDHEKVSEYVENLGEMLALRYAQEDWNKIRPLIGPAPSLPTAYLAVELQFTAGQEALTTLIGGALGVRMVDL